MINANDIIWTKELVRCTHSSFWKKTIKTLASLGVLMKKTTKTLPQYVLDLLSKSCEASIFTREQAPG